jgi:osmotically inducible lipoprotein OsmB
MKMFFAIALLPLALAACGTTTSQRALGGAAIGAGAGAIAGPIGVGTGAVVGGVVGVVTPAKKVNLGKPVWDRK